MSHQHVSLVWWMPNEFWEASAASNPAAGPQAVKQLVDIVDPYFIVAVLDGSIGPFGGLTPKAREEIVKDIRLSIGDQKFEPLPDEKLPPDLRNFFAMMKPVLANVVGQFGSGLEFVAFEGRGANGKRLVDPMAEQRVAVELGPEVFAWRLPLGSLMPAVYDPATGEEFPGNYKFSPYTGATLKLKPD